MSNNINIQKHIKEYFFKYYKDLKINYIDKNKIVEEQFSSTRLVIPFYEQLKESSSSLGVRLDKLTL